jgi:hypothetical protein
MPNAKDSMVSGTVNSTQAHANDGSEAIIRESQCGSTLVCSGLQDKGPAEGFGRSLHIWQEQGWLGPAFRF